MPDGGPEDLRTALVTGARLLFGWAYVAVAVLDLTMGFETGPYLLFHLVLLTGGLLLLGLGRLHKPPTPFAYVVITALAVATLVLAAIPPTSSACCMRDLDVRHGYPLTVLGWDHGQQLHFAPAHTVADVAFWFLAWLLLRAVVTELRPRRGAPKPDAHPTHAEERAAPAPSASALVEGEEQPTGPPGGESVGGLP
jgi:hypothetical protein